MALDPNELADLQPSTRLEVGRCYNAYARMRRAEEDVRAAKAEFDARLVALRQGHRLSAAFLARAMGVPLGRVQRADHRAATPVAQGRAASNARSGSSDRGRKS